MFSASTPRQAAGAPAPRKLLGRRLGFAVPGLAALVLPHFYGAPLAPAESSAVPEVLGHRSATGVMVARLLFWGAPGLSVGGLYRRLVPGASAG